MATEENDSARTATDLVEFVDGRPAGIGVRSLAVDGHGRLTRKPDSVPLDFTFRYRGILFAVRAESEEHSGRMQFHAHLGNLPYSAESRAKRADALAIVAAAGRALGGRVQLTPEQRILLLEEMRCEEPLTPMVLMSSTVRLLLEAQPFLELLTQVVEPPAAAGHANVQEY